MKKPFEAKAKRLYSIFASVFFMLAVLLSQHSRRTVTRCLLSQI